MITDSIIAQAPALIADDSDFDRYVQIQALKRAGFNGPIEVFRDGLAAWDYLNHSGIYSEAHRPVIALFDIMMPKLNGLDLLRQVRMHDDLAMLPVVIVSASLNRSDMMESYRLGASAYLLKNGRLDEIAGVLKERLGSYMLAPQKAESTRLAENLP